MHQQNLQLLSVMSEVMVSKLFVCVRRANVVTQVNSAEPHMHDDTCCTARKVDPSGRH